MKSLLIWTVIVLSSAASTLAAAAPCQASLPAGTIIRMFPGERLVAGRAFGPVVFTVTPDVRLFPNRPAVIPRGSKVLGNVMESKQAGRLVGRAQTQIVLTSILTADSCEYPIDAKALEAGRYTATRDGVVVGRGHARRDLFEVLFPPTTIYQLIRIPSRGPSLVLDCRNPDNHQAHGASDRAIGGFTSRSCTLISRAECACAGSDWVCCLSRPDD